MTVEQRPILRDADHDKDAYSAFAAAQFRILKDYMKVAKLNTYSRVVTLANGVVITCQKSFNREDIFISVPTGDYTEVITKAVMLPLFICAPRVLGANNGYNKNGGQLFEAGTGNTVYPLSDADKTSATIGYGPFTVNAAFNGVPQKPAGSPLKIYRDGQLYGNVDWKGKNTAKEGGPSNAPVLTWKGPTGRSVPFDFSKHIDGLTTADIQFSPDSPEYYTCFGPNVYRGGSVAVTIPTVGDVTPKILGAAISRCDRDGESTLVYVCVVNNHYAGRLGFFDEVWVQYGGKENEGWRTIYSQASGRPSQCWFFNQSGNRCTMGTLELVLDIQAESATLIKHDGGTGEYSASIPRKGATKITHSGEYHIYSDYKEDTRVTARITVDSKKETTFTNTFNRVTTDTTVHSVYPEDVDPDAPYVIIGPDVYVEGAYTTSGGYCACGTGKETMTFPAETCGMGTIVATNACGQTATKQVRMLSGSWGPIVLSGNDCYTGTGIVIAYLTSRDTRKVIAISLDGCGYSPTNGDRDCYPLPSAFSYAGYIDAPGIPISCGSCKVSNVTSIPAVVDCGSDSACYFYTSTGVYWTRAWIKGCYVGTQSWEC